MLPHCTLIVVANKYDLVTEEQMNDIYKNINQKWDFVTSAKTGDNVEDMFLELAKRLLANHW